MVSIDAHRQELLPMVLDLPYVALLVCWQTDCMQIDTIGTCSPAGKNKKANINVLNTV